jgi:hypothetical protein
MGSSSFAGENSKFVRRNLATKTKEKTKVVSASSAGHHRHRLRRTLMKKLLVLLVLAAAGFVVFKKLQDDPDSGWQSDYMPAPPVPTD